MPRTRQAKAEQPGSNAALCRKLRAETTAIVSCVAKYCEELKGSPAKARNGGKEASVGEHDADDDSSTRRDGGPEAEDDAEASEEGKAECGQLSPVEKSTEDDETERREETKGWKGSGLESVASERREDGGAERENCEILPQLANDEHDCGWAPLELPIQCLDAVERGYAAFRQSGEEWLDRIGAMHDQCAPNRGHKLPGGLTLWSYWERSDGFAEEILLYKEQMDIVSCGHNPPSQEKKLRTLHNPQRMQCNLCEPIASSEEFLRDESSALLRKMIRVNTQAELLVKDIVVPNVFARDWGRSLCGIRPPHSIMGGGGGIQQLLLPCDLVRGDADNLVNAPWKLVSIANSYLHDLERSDVSLTNASLNTRSVWNHEAVVKRFTEVCSESLKVLITPLNADPASQHGILKHRSSYGSTSSSQNFPSSAVTKRKTNSNPEKTQLPPVGTKLAVLPDDNAFSTDYFLSDKFLNCNWGEAPKAVDATMGDVSSPSNSKGSPQYEQFIHQLARPALWDLMRKKLIHVNEATLHSALNCTSLATLEAVIYQQFREVKKMSLNPSAASSVEIIEACASLRQAAWLHTLRIVSIIQTAEFSNGDMLSAVLARIISSTKYKLVIGPSNWKDLHTLLKVIGGDTLGATSYPVPDPNTANFSEVDQPILLPNKKQKTLQVEQQVTPVRVLCSIQFLEQDELLDELCTEQQIYFIERDLPPPIDILVDESNCVCVVCAATFRVEANVRNFICSLARLQIQFQKCWIIIAFDASGSAEVQEAMNLFYAALVQFRIDIQVFISFSLEEASQYVRVVVDKCAEIALNYRRVLPRLWFKRPFLLEEESQFERFLVSTKIINHFAAQSLLHKICMEDLFTKQIDELKALAQGVITDEQLQLLWGLVQQDHGLKNTRPY